MARPTKYTKALAAPMTRFFDCKPGFLIDRSCEQLRKGLSGAWCFKRIQVSGSERYTDKPDKNRYSHVCEADEYLVSGGGELRTLMRGNKPRFSGTVVVNTDFNPLAGF